ncbi:MAG TPA: peptidase U32 family protein [Saprospiraceae bacterium]|jgi:putative protease|nr:U32 family peptidase [Saprospiraceae bacterium]HMV24209.1 peptidase U32 family protein [Saprospiraceae bacterium]HMX86730.1 peptidase U32 family protein [Saprospiraceae bacterium]HMZ74275.1 peptidase U32 family protein [Saprospiraceae bacterium]HNE49112.1 peptidase U32 family protein [Saprospiraceae bacterium]
MSNIKSGIELMAPAGSFESMMAAIKAGCNSVYFGVEQLNMRARSSNNFTLEDLKEIARIGKENNVKTYLTLNTILYDHDIKLMKNIVDAVKENGITAIIAADHAVMNYAKKIGVELHISTQANISNIDTIEFYANFADVVVMARELSLMQVADITREIKRRNVTGPSGKLVEVEIFAHGALCMAVSGKCYMSLHSHYASANRGACIQNCRRSYVVTDKDEGIEFEVDNEYIMSAKDLSTIGFLDQILDAGVSVLKLEGRGRSADYVYTVTKCYREAIDAYQNGSYSRENVANWEARLATVFNRGFWDGYYLGRKMGEWNDVYGSKATKRKIYIGKGIKFFEKASVAEFKLETHSLSVGDEIMVTGPTTGYIEAKVSEIRINDQPVEKVNRGEQFSIHLSEKIRPSDKLYKVVDA